MGLPVGPEGRCGTTRKQGKRKVEMGRRRARERRGCPRRYRLPHMLVQESEKRVAYKHNVVTLMSKGFTVVLLMFSGVLPSSVWGGDSTCESNRRVRGKNSRRISTVWLTWRRIALGELWGAILSPFR